MGRYNLKVSKFAFEGMQGPDGGAMMGNDDFGMIFGVGTVVYGFSFLINGPLTDRFGGKLAILLGAGGATVVNFVMGLCAMSLMYQGAMHQTIAENFVVIFSILYGVNMYFQSFGAVAIVKVNALGSTFANVVSLARFLEF